MTAQIIRDEIDAAVAGLHGSFVFSCNHEHGDDRYKDPVYRCSVVIVAGTDQNDGKHAYGLGDVEDLIVNPDMYEEKVELHGTHELTDEQLDELSVDGEIFMGRGPDGNLPDGIDLDEVLELTAGADDESEYVVAGVSHDNKLVVLTTLLFHEIAKNPASMADRGIAQLYGTHVLPEGLLAALFDDDED